MKPETAKKIKAILDSLPPKRRKATFELGMQVASEYRALINRLKKGPPSDGEPRQTDKPA